MEDMDRREPITAHSYGNIMMDIWPVGNFPYHPFLPVCSGIIGGLALPNLYIPTQHAAALPRPEILRMDTNMGSTNHAYTIS